MLFDILKENYCTFRLNPLTDCFQDSKNKPVRTRGSTDYANVFNANKYHINQTQWSPEHNSTTKLMEGEKSE